MSDSTSQNGRRAVRRVAIVGKPGRPEIGELGARMRAWLEARSIPSRFSLIAPGDEYSADDAGDAGAAMEADLLSLAADADLVAVLGGDGTMVSVARGLTARPVPVLGVNFGRVGFLAQVGPADWEEQFSRVLEQGVLVEERMGLSYSLVREGQTIASGIAVNDVVATRGAIARLATLDLEADGAPVGSLRADGLILSTPMGSTGYSGSARGPILHPALHVYTVTAICPFLSNFLPLVLDGGSSFRVTARDAEPELFITVDGQILFPFRAGDNLDVSGLPGRILFACAENGSSYFGKLRDLGFIGA